MAWKLITRRQYLTMRAIEQGASLFGAIEAVASVSIEHPEWELDERRTWPEWEKQEKADARAARKAQKKQDA